MPITPYSKVAFRCNKCGRLHTSADAAEAAHPHCCRLCGAGVKFSESGVKTASSENWEVLADATPERLAELGLAPDDVERHERWARGEVRASQNIEVTASDGPGTQDGAS